MASFYYTLSSAVSTGLPPNVASYSKLKLVSSAMNLDSNTASVLLQDTVSLAYWSSVQLATPLVAPRFIFFLNFNATAPAWAASSVYAAGAIIKDVNLNYQLATTGGTSGATAPAWSTVIAGSTADGTVAWLNLGTLPGTALLAMIASQMPAGTISMA